MAKKERGDPVEREAHKKLNAVLAHIESLPLHQTALDLIQHGDQPSLFSEETREYIAAAQARIAATIPRIPKDLHRHPDADTSVEAAQVIARRLSEMQDAVLAAFTRYGEMTDEQLEELDEFREYKYSTARKRRTELVAKGYLASCGKALNSSGTARMTLWNLTERVTK